MEEINNLNLETICTLRYDGICKEAYDNVKISIHLGQITPRYIVALSFSLTSIKVNPALPKGLFPRTVDI